MVHGSPLNAPVITLGEKKSLFGEKAQANEYVSYALYYWPDPANPDGPYKPIDGKKNKRLRSMDDSGRMADFLAEPFPAAFPVIRGCGAAERDSGKSVRPFSRIAGFRIRPDACRR